MFFLLQMRKSDVANNYKKKRKNKEEIKEELINLLMKENLRH